MFLNKNIKFFKKDTAFFIAIIFVISLIFSENAAALNSYNGQGKPTVFVGYKIKDEHTLELYTDKPTQLTVAEQFKIFEGNGIGGTEIKINSMTSKFGTMRQEFSKAGIYTQALPNGGGFTLTIDGSFKAGAIYTAVMNSNISGTFPFGWYTSHKDTVFSFTVPTTFADLNGDGTYSNSATAVMNTWPENGTSNVAVENGIWITTSIPVKNWSEVKNGLVLTKNNGQSVWYDDYLYTKEDNITKTSPGIFSPIVNDDHNSFIFLQTIGGNSRPCYNFDADTQYVLSIPDITLVNEQVIPAHTISFHTAGSTVSNPFKVQSPEPIVVTNNGDDLIIDWNKYAPLSTPIAMPPVGVTLPVSAYVSPPPSGYNVYASTDKYWNYVKLNKSPITDTLFNTFNSGLKPNTTYYFRLTTLSNSNIFNNTISDPIESGFSILFAQATTPSDTTAPKWSSESKIDASNIIVNSLTLNWDAAVDSYGVSAYNIYQNDTLIASVNGDTTTYNVSGLELDKQYIFKIQAGDDSNNWSTNGPSVAIKLTDIAAPTWIEGSTVSASDINKDRLILNWSSANDDVGVTAYKIYQNNSVIGTVSSDISSFAVSGLETDTQYTFKIEAGDGAGNWSANGPSVITKTLDNYEPIATRILTASARNSIEIGLLPVTEAITAVVYDQHNNEISGKRIIWDLAEKSIGVSISSEGVLTVQPFAEQGTITAKCVVDGTEVSSTKEFQIKAPISQTTFNNEEVTNAISNSADYSAIHLPASSNRIVAIDSQSLEAIKASNKPMLLTNVENTSLELKPEDMNLGGRSLNDVKELHIGSVKLDSENSFQLNTDSAKDQLSGGSFSFATLPFKLSAVAILNDNNQLQVTSFNNPITVTVPTPLGLSLSSNEQLRVCRYNTTTGKWEDKGPAVLKDGSITFNTSGFSYWTVMIQTITNNTTNTNEENNNTTNTSTNTNEENNNTTNTNSTTFNENAVNKSSTSNITKINSNSSAAAVNSTDSSNASTEVIASGSSTSDTNNSGGSAVSNTQTNTGNKETSANNSNSKAVEQKRSLFGKNSLTIGVLLTLIACLLLRIIFIAYKKKAR